jgi:triacylglycerol esterase/lipase EstA (alpha/beta hydrolase family)
MSRFIRIAIAALMFAGVAVAAAPAASAAPSSGFNDWSCRPSAAHPQPLLLLHGLGGNGPGNYATLGPYLAGLGYCAYSPTYGEEFPPFPVGGLVSIEQSSSHEIAGVLDHILASTGASKVDIVGHSEGGFQSLYIPKVLQYSNKVARVVALAPPSHGTTFAGLVGVAELLGIRAQVDYVLNTFGCPACDELITDGSAVSALNSGPIAQPGVAYTIIASRSDELVTPTSTAFVNEPGVHNEYVQDSCPNDPVGHVGLAFDLDVSQLVANALDPAHPQSVTCSFGPTF